jgi:hypothetical protein
MPRNFDDVLPSDRTFVIRGETFTFKDVRPEVIQAWGESTNGKDDETVWEQQDKQILMFLDEPDHERWRELRKRETDPVTIAQQNAVLTWLFEAATGRPTEPVSPSPSGPGKTGASSKAE